MFSDELKNISWEETTERIARMTDNDVRRALAKDHCDVNDFMALISPAAEPYLEVMARLPANIPRSASARPCRCSFLSTSPIHALTPACIAGSIVRTQWPAPSSPQSRLRTSIKPSSSSLHSRTSFSLRARTQPRLAPPYLAKAIDIAKKYFSNVKIEVMPLSTEDYKTLADHGMNGVICFQETYNHEHYKLYHPRGMKSKFEWRCDGFDRMGMAGVHSIGMGVLIGLEKEWRTDVVMMAHHLRYLQKHYWKTKYSVNFPRMRPAQNEGFQPNCFMTDKQLAQATFAMRIFDHDVRYLLLYP